MIAAAGARDLVLYDYQGEAITEAKACLRDGITNIAFSSPTGSGKTIIAASMILDAYKKGSRVVFLADRVALIDQTSAVLDEYGIPHGVIQADHWRWRPWEQVQVASPQTLERREWPEPLDLIIVDECHTARKVTHERIDRRDCVTIGLTATPFSRGMGRHYDAVVNVATTHDLIEQGRLSKFRVFAPSEPDMKGAKVAAGEWTISEASKRAIPIVGDCVREYLRHADGLKFLVFGADIAHCEALQRQFQTAGVQVALYTSRTPDTERRETLEEYRKPDSYIRGLASVAALSKGFDVPDVECIIMARPLRSSLTEHLQVLGRGLRAHPGKEECIVLDHAGNMLRFWDEMIEFFDRGAVELDDGKKRKKKTKKKQAEDAGGRKCPTCSHVHPARPSCPECGHEYPRKKRPHADGELAEIRAGAPKETKQSVFSQLVHIQRSRGYKEGWVAHKYKERFGTWPRGMEDEPKVPSTKILRWVKSRQIAYAKAQAKRKAS